MRFTKINPNEVNSTYFSREERKEFLQSFINSDEKAVEVHDYEEHYDSIASAVSSFNSGIKLHGFTDQIKVTQKKGRLFLLRKDIAE